MNEIETAAGLPQSPGYRYADLVGGRLFVAGQVPLDASGEVVAGGADVHAAQCIANLLTLVESRGFTREDIHQLTIYVVGEHANLIDAWTTVVREFGGEVPPATLLGVQCLGYREQLVEIDAQVERA